MSDSEPSDHESDSDHEAKRRKTVVVSNKKVDPDAVPKKPAVSVKRVDPNGPFFFKMIFTNGALLRKFMEPIAHSVKKIRFALSKTEEFTGFRMEAHDA